MFSDIFMDLLFFINKSVLIYQLFLSTVERDNLSCRANIRLSYPGNATRTEAVI